jgi:uncharacterized membrane protein YphA (DoxX/SURF4 family)
MQSAIAVSFFNLPRVPLAMCVAGIVVSVIALWAAGTDLIHARPLDKIVALANLAFAAPMAVFGALHIWGVDFVLAIVPAYMPWRLFWAYFVGVALIAASLSIATKIFVRWSGMLLALMMLLFVALLDIPGVASTPGDRFGWTLLLRELTFAAGGWLFAAPFLTGRSKSILITAGRIVIAITALFWGVEQCLHPHACPVVPLEKLMPAFIPAQLLIGYLTGAFLLGTGVFILLGKRTRLAATCLGGWTLLLVLIVYGPILISALSVSDVGANVEGINYFFDTLYFAGAVLALAAATLSGPTPAR